MGFLIGAYGKLMAGQNVRDLQRQMVSVQSRLRQATKQIGQMEKQLQSEQRHAENAIRSQGMQVSQMFQIGEMGIQAMFSAPDTPKELVDYQKFQMYKTYSTATDANAKENYLKFYNISEAEMEAIGNSNAYQKALNGNKFSDDFMQTVKIAQTQYAQAQAETQGMQTQMKQQVQEAKTQAQQSVQQQLSQVQDSFEQYREFMLMPLQDLEADLQIQKDNLESREKIAEAEYQAMKDMEKAGVQMFKPEYTGGGQ
jgi:hypothetical protein